jgi:hypothetical protein
VLSLLTMRINSNMDDSAASVRDRGSARGCLRLQRAASFGSPRAVRAVRTQYIGEDGDRVVALEGDEGGRFG